MQRATCRRLMNKWMHPNPSEEGQVLAGRHRVEEYVMLRTDARHASNLLQLVRIPTLI